MSFDDEELNKFRKEVNKQFHLPENYQIYKDIANTSLWIREIFVWQYKQKVKDAIKKLRKDSKKEYYIALYDLQQELGLEEKP